MKEKESFRLTVYIYLIALALTYILFPWGQSKNTSAVLGRSYPLTLPDIPAMQGDTLSIEGASVIVSAGTFESDVYFRVDRTARAAPKSVSGLWQVSDIYNARIRLHSNDDEVPVSSAKKDFIFSFPYSDSRLVSEQGVYFREDSLRLARGDSENGPWVVIESSVGDPINNTVSTLTRQGGHYMVVGGNSPDARSGSVDSVAPDVTSGSVSQSQSEESDKTDMTDKTDTFDMTDKSDNSEILEKATEEVEFLQSLENVYRAVIAVPDALLRSLGLL